MPGAGLTLVAHPPIHPQARTPALQEALSLPLSLLLPLSLSQSPTRIRLTDRGPSVILRSQR